MRRTAVYTRREPVWARPDWERKCSERLPRRGDSGSSSLTAGVDIFTLARRMGTSAKMIGRT